MHDQPLRRVLMTADAVGGVWTHALDLARGLGARGVSVTLAVLGPPPSGPAREAARSIPGLQLVETGLPLDWTAPDPASLHGAAQALATLAESCGADLVHLNSPALAAFGAFRQPVVVAMHSCLASWWRAMRGSEPLPPDFVWRTELTRHALQQASAIVAPSRSFAREVDAIYAPRRPVIPVLNGRSPFELRLETHRRDPRPDFVFAAGRLWDEAKGLATLDEAAAAITAPVAVAGPLAGPAGHASPVHHLRCLGPLSEPGMARWMADAAVYCAPARYEPFGLGVLEAAQAGCALVLSDLPSFRELWSGAAIFVPPGEPNILAETVDALVWDLPRRRRLAEAARERSRTYSVGAMTAGMLAAYGEALAATPCEAAA